MGTHRRSKSSRRLLTSLAIVIGLLVVVVGGLTGLAAAYAQRFPPGTRIGPVAVGGQNYLQALEAVGQATDAFLTEGLSVTAEERRVPVRPTVSASEEFAYDLYGVDPTESVDQAAARAISQGLAARLVRTTQGLLLGWRLPLVQSINEEALTVTLSETFAEDEARARSATFRVTAATGELTITNERAGERFDYTAAVARIRHQVSQLDRTPVALTPLPEQPDVTAADIRALEPAVKAALERTPLTITAADKEFPVDRGSVARALTAVRRDGRVALALDAEKLTEIFDAVAAVVDVPVQEGRFRVEGDRIVEFAESRVGTELDREATSRTLAERLAGGERSLAASVRETQPQFTADGAATLGIKELVAEGRTNFSGSPVNRRFNIGVGAQKLHGLLIQPKEEFSLLKALGPIDGKNGYRQELVIKGDRTIPEYGGGLCQVGTTFFRLVLNAGLPILERRNHSYRVRYYEPPVGMDATIYEPKPDFRFVNDYSAPLLLQARIEGDDLVFQFYGTKDARTAKTTQPRVYNVKPPPPKVTIETTDLKPGETKCIEKPHPGSDAEFTYTVTYPNGEVKQEVFKSHYRPWAEVCLLGVKKITSDAKNTNGD